MAAVTKPIILDETGQDIVTALEAIAENMGTSAGHTIQNDTGTDMQRRDKLQFKGVYVEDNQANDVTKVDIVREFQSKAEIEALTGEAKKGFEVIEDNEEYIPYTGSDILFDNTDTSFEGENVQEVLEEVDTALDNIDSKLTGKVLSGAIANNASKTLDVIEGVGIIFIYRASSGLYAMLTQYSTTFTTVGGQLPSAITLEYANNQVKITNTVGYTIGYTVINNPWA